MGTLSKDENGEWPPNMPENVEQATYCAKCEMYTLDATPGSGTCMACGSAK